MFEWFVLLLLGIIWGASYPFIKIGLVDIPPASFVAGRVLLAAFLLGVIWVVRRERGPGWKWRTLWPLLAVGLLNGAAPYTLITWGETEISSGLAAILTGTMPMFTVILAHLMTRDEKITGLKGLGIGIGFVGVVLIFLPAIENGVQGSLLGMLAVVLACAAYALAAIVAHRFIRGLSHIVIATVQFATASAIMLPIALISDKPWTLQPSPAATAALLAISVLGTAIAYLLYYWLIEHTGATRTSLVTYIIPVSGLGLGALLLGERPDLNSILGLVLIVLGVALVNRRAGRPIERRLVPQAIPVAPE